MRTPLVLLLLPLALAAEGPELRTTAKDRTALSVTIYQNGLAAIRDTRRVALPAGPSRLAFADLLPTLRPKSATLLDPGGDIQVRERNYEFNLLSPASLVDASLGLPVRIRGEDGKADWVGTLASVPLHKRRLGLIPMPLPDEPEEWDDQDWHSLSPPPPPPPPPGYELSPLAEDEEDSAPLWRRDLIILQRRDPKVLVGTKDGFTPAKPSSLGLQSLPKELRASPTLFQSLDAKEGQTRDLTLLYTAENLEWSCHYESTLDASAQHLDLRAFATVKNLSGAPLTNANLQLIAGEPHLVYDPPPESTELLDGVPGGVPGGVIGGVVGGPPVFKEEKLSEYPLFTLDRPVSLQDQQEKQLALFQAHRIPVTLRFLTGSPAEDFSRDTAYLENPVFDATPRGSPRNAEWVFAAWKLRHYPKVLRLGTIQNTKENQLGRALPVGSLNLRYQDPNGALVILPGADGTTRTIPQTPPGEDIELILGPARGFQVDRKGTRRKLIPSKPRKDSEGNLHPQGRWEYEIQVHISNDAPEAAEITVREPIQSDWELLASTHQGARTWGSAVDFTVSVPAHGQATLRYQVISAPGPLRGSD